MKTKYVMLAGALGLSVSAFAQEIDDMYFNARDRVQHNESSQAALASVYALEDKKAVSSNPVNPSDTYTGRGVNPEFSAQQKNGAEIIQENPDYFLASYQPKNINSSLSSSGSNYCNCSNPYSMSYGGFGNPYGSFYTPYGYSPYGMMGYPGMYGPYTSLGYSMGSYGSMWSMSMGYGMGSMYGYPYGMGGMYSNPYRYGYGSGYGMPYTTVRVVPDVVTYHGRRPDRTGSVGGQSYSSGYAVAGTNGRTREAGSSRTSYYDPTWRNDPSNFTTRTYNYGGRGAGYSSTGRSWDSMNSGRTRSYDSFGSGSRGSMGGFSGGGVSGGSGGGGRSRGRN